MTKFADQLYDDLMREHGSLLADTRPPAAARRSVGRRRVLLAASASGLAAAATAAGLAVGGGGPAYALTTNSDGTITLAIYQASGIPQANAKLHQLGTEVVVVPIQPGCPPLRPPAVSPKGKLVRLGIGRSRNGSITVSGHAPAGDIIVVGVRTTPNGWEGVSQVSSLPAPACISPPARPGTGSGSGSGSGS
jgi:hypothetical protein